MTDIEILRNRLKTCNREVERKLVFMAVLTEMLKRRNARPPVVVGGSAVEIYSSGQYVSLDIDILGSRDIILEALQQLNFQHNNGDPGSVRWSDEFNLVVDWQGDTVDCRIFHLEDNDGNTVACILSINDIIIDRLCSYKFWNYKESGEWAKTLFELAINNDIGLDMKYLINLAKKEDVFDVLQNIVPDNMLNNTQVQNNDSPGIA